MTRRERLCLAAGAGLVCGCFFAGISLGYRAVHLLFALPALLALAERAKRRSIARLMRSAAAACVVVVWVLPVQRLMVSNFGPFWQPEVIAQMPLGTPLPGFGFWVLREALWWFLVTVLLALLVRLLLDSPAVADLRRRLPGRIPA